MYIKFQELEVWKKSKDLCKKIYILTSRGLISKDRWLRDQIRRSTISISSNIAEWNWRASIKQYIYFLKIARGSCSEVFTQSLIAWEIWYLPESEYLKLIDEITILGKQISAYIRSLEKIN